MDGRLFILVTTSSMACPSSSAVGFPSSLMSNRWITDWLSIWTSTPRVPGLGRKCHVPIGVMPLGSAGKGGWSATASTIRRSSAETGAASGGGFFLTSATPRMGSGRCMKRNCMRSTSGARSTPTVAGRRPSLVAMACMAVTTSTAVGAPWAAKTNWASLVLLAARMTPPCVLFSAMRIFQWVRGFWAPAPTGKAGIWAICSTRRVSSAEMGSMLEKSGPFISLLKVVRRLGVRPSRDPSGTSSCANRVMTRRSNSARSTLWRSFLARLVEAVSSSPGFWVFCMGITMGSCIRRPYQGTMVR
mmetsp:Transcript_41455/g.81256  ORF Transcript_41455/g.81256 Transcript_41455/m.81256 type:complete len:302 (-) Transcript_41455:1384-2289(-)